MGITDCTRRVKITIPSAQIGSGSHVGLVVWMNSDAVPSEMIDYDGAYSIQSDGGDLFATTTIDSSTRVPLFVSRISLDNNPANSLLSFFVRLPTVESGAAYEFYLWYASTETESVPAVDSTYGRNNVFQDYFAAWDFEQDPGGSSPQLTDLTGNGRNGTVYKENAGNMSRESATIMDDARQWRCEQGDFSNECWIDIANFNASSFGVSPFTLMWVAGNPTVGEGLNYAGCLTSNETTSADNTMRWGPYTANTMQFGCHDTNPAGQAIARTVTTLGSNHIYHGIRGPGFDICQDGSSVSPGAALLATQGDFSNTSNFRMFGAGWGGREGEYVVEFASVREGFSESGRVTTEYNNFNSPSSFFTVGTPGGTAGVVDITVIVVDEDLSPINLCQVAVYKTSDDTQLMNEDTNSSGIATESYEYTADTDVYIRCRKSSSGSTRYVPRRVEGTITSSGLTQTVTMSEDTVASA